jgi:type I restriction enzyme S subunit
VRAGWRVKKLDELCEFKNGLWEGKKEPYIHVGVIRNTNFTKEGRLDDSNIAYLDVESKQYSTRKLDYGDIILEKSGGGPKQAVGRVIPFEKKEGEFSFSNFTSVVRIRDKNELNYSYLHRYLHYLYISGATEPMQKHSTGIRNLQLKEYKEVEVEYPSIEVQQRIVATLDEAFAGIAIATANAEKNLQNARELFESTLQTVFSEKGEGWVDYKKPLSEFCELVVDCEHKTAPTQEEGIPSIRTPNIGKGKLILDGVYRVSEDTYREWTRRAEPQPGDLILAREAPAGNVVVIPENLRVCLGQRTVLIRPNLKIFEPEFLVWLLLQSKMQQKLLAHSRGATVQHVNMKDIRALDVGAIPPLLVQRNIISVVRKAHQETQRLETIYKQKLAILLELKQSILKKAFAGELHS